MTVPVIQGMLKYAYKADPANTDQSCASAGPDCDKSWAEGWAFAAAVLPRLNYCDSAVATLVKANLDVELTGAQPQMKDGYAKLKSEVEKTYPCLGITCAEVGEFQNNAGVYTGMEMCTDVTVATDATPGEDTGSNLIAGYAPATNVVPHSLIDLDMKEINTLVGVTAGPGVPYTDALFVYENGGGGKCSETDISGAVSGDSCFGKTTNDAKGNSVKGSGAIRTLHGFATCGSTCEDKMKTEKWRYPDSPRICDLRLHV